MKINHRERTQASISLSLHPTADGPSGTRAGNLPVFSNRQIVVRDVSDP